MAPDCTHAALLVALVLTIFLQFSAAKIETDDALKRFEIDVKPGGVVHDYEESFGDFKCKFTYSCQGGTNEKWDLVLTASEDKQHYSCTVERPNGRSYLFFQTFEMQIEGARIVETAAFADISTPLKKSEYSIDYNTGKVSHGKSFNSQLAKLDVFATTLRHGEL